MQQIKKLKKKYRFTFIVMLCCVFVFTFGQFIPIYFIDINVKQQFYLWVLGVLVVTTTITVFNFSYKPNKNKFVVGLASLFVGILTCILFGCWLFFLLLSVWTEATTFYINKDNPKIKIISRYADQGAFGGGTEPEDFQVVLQRPIFTFCNLQTSIDTTSIDKNKWVKYKE